MNRKSIHELDSLPDRIKLHRQADKRGILIVEGPSDERFIQRLAPGRWALFRAGTRNVVISTVEETVVLSVDRVAGLIDQDFDGITSDIQRRGLPIYWYDNADMEGFLFMTTALDSLVKELSSEQKLNAYGGVHAVREKSILVALEIAALRISNVNDRWGLPFDNIDLSKKIDRNNLSLKRLSYCQALADACQADTNYSALHAAIETRTASGLGASGQLFFSGKDALVVVGVALRGKIGNCTTDTTKADHLGRILRLSAPRELLDLPPFNLIISHIDAA
jgi:hypothetical protein